MRTRDWFEVGARLIGLWYLTLAIEDAREVAIITLGMWAPANTLIGAYWSRIVTHAIVGASLLMLAGLLTDVLFRRSRPTSEMSSVGVVGQQTDDL